MPAPSPSTRVIARVTGFSKATVANALNGSPSVAPETAKRILAAAKELGYQRNPMIGTLMSAMRRSQASGLRGVLAIVDIAEPSRPAHGPFHRELLLGSKARAEELGFKLEPYVVDGNTLSFARLNSILKARGIRGLIIQPSWQVPAFGEFDWSSFVGIYTDYIPNGSPLHSVCCDHYRSMLLLLQTLCDRGYRRPGLLLDSGRDARIHYRMTAAAHAFQLRYPEIRMATPCVDSDMRPASVMEWMRRETPDVVVSQDMKALDILQQEGLLVPKDIGYACLNMAKASKPCAGLDLRPRQIGACAVELLIAQMHHNAWGLPAHPTTTTVYGQFVDGPTVRPAPANAP